MHPKNILNKHKIRPSKSLGQNFLTDKTALNRVVGAAEIKPTDIILEIGPGLGILTQELARRAKKVIAIEKDPKMVEILKETLKDYKNIEIICGDILKTDVSCFMFQVSRYKLVANLPYYITSPVIRKFLESERPPELMVLMVQKEVAQRICANPPNMNLLAVSVQFYANPEIISYVSKKSFWPQPKVDSAIIKIKPYGGQTPVNSDLFFRIIKAGFSQPRKQLVNNLLVLCQKNGIKLNNPIQRIQNKEKIIAWLLKNKVNPNQRAETLSIKDWKSLTKSFRI